MTCTTPLDASTSGWTTLASSTMTVPPSTLTVSVSPATVSSFWPSLRSAAVSVPGTTW